MARTIPAESGSATRALPELTDSDSSDPTISSSLSNVANQSGAYEPTLTISGGATVATTAYNNIGGVISVTGSTTTTPSIPEPAAGTATTVTHTATSGSITKTIAFSVGKAALSDPTVSSSLSNVTDQTGAYEPTLTISSGATVLTTAYNNVDGSISVTGSTTTTPSIPEPTAGSATTVTHTATAGSLTKAIAFAVGKASVSEPTISSSLGNVADQTGAYTPTLTISGGATVSTTAYNNVDGSISVTGSTTTTPSVPEPGIGSATTVTHTATAGSLTKTIAFAVGKASVSEPTISSSLGNVTNQSGAYAPTLTISGGATVSTTAYNNVDGSISVTGSTTTTPSVPEPTPGSATTVTHTATAGSLTKTIAFAVGKAATACPTEPTISSNLGDVADQTGAYAPTLTLSVGATVLTTAWNNSTGAVVVTGSTSTTPSVPEPAVGSSTTVVHVATLDGLTNTIAFGVGKAAVAEPTVTSSLGNVADQTGAYAPTLTLSAGATVLTTAHNNSTGAVSVTGSTTTTPSVPEPAAGSGTVVTHTATASGLTKTIAYVVGKPASLAGLAFDEVDLTDGSWTLYDPDSLVKSVAFSAGYNVVTWNVLAVGSNSYNPSVASGGHSWPRWYKALTIGGTAVVADDWLEFVTLMQCDTAVNDFHQQVLAAASNDPSSIDPAIMAGTGGLISKLTSSSCAYGTWMEDSPTTEASGTPERALCVVNRGGRGIGSGAYGTMNSSQQALGWNTRSADRIVIAAASDPVYVMVGAGTRGNTDTIADDAQNSFRIGYKAITHNMSF
jgi:hypothetical protein